VGTGAACDETTFVNTCDGTVLVTCAGGKTSRLDCAANGIPQTCFPATMGPTGFPTAVCGGAGRTCPGGSESCADGVIDFCLFGSKAQVDCKRYGLSGCTLTSPEVGGPTLLAQCTP
jgi:hypothetical protein